MAILPPTTMSTLLQDWRGTGPPHSRRAIPARGCGSAGAFGSGGATPKSPKLLIVPQVADETSKWTMPLSSTASIAPWHLSGHHICCSTSRSSKPLSLQRIWGRRCSSGASRIGIERTRRNASNLTGEIKSSTSTSTQAGMSTPSRHASMAPTECPHSARSNTHTGSSAVAFLSPRLQRSQVHLHTSPPRSLQMPSLHRAQQEWKNTNGIVIFDAGSADTLRLGRTDGGLPCDAFG